MVDLIESSRLTNRHAHSCRERKRIIPRSYVCWLHAKQNEKDEDIHNTIEQIRYCAKIVHTCTFRDLDTCIDFIIEIEENEAVYLVLSEPVDQQYMFLFNSINQVKAIYLICPNKFDSDPESIANWSKVKRITDKFENIFIQINNDLRQHFNQLISFQTCARPENVSKFTSNDLDSSFLCSQLIKEMLIDVNLEYDQDFMDTFIDVCRAENQDNHSQLTNITCFQTTYKNHSPIWWYTKEPFIYSTVNRALRTQDVNTLFMMAFFIRDLHLQLVELHQRTSQDHSIQTVFRGQGMNDSQFQQLQRNVGGLLSFNNFLSTSSDYDVSLLFARSARDNPELTHHLPH